jgi:RNA polymerase sigma factor (sigma-70 family)
MKYDWSLADDAVQEAAIYCTENYSKIDSDPKSWCLTVVRNKSIDLIRKQNRKSLTIDFYPPSRDDSQGNSTPSPLELAVDQSPTPDRGAEKLDESKLIKCMLRSLKTRDRDIFESFYKKEESQHDIAARLQTTTNAVGCRLHQLRTKLRKQFSKELADLDINA